MNWLPNYKIILASKSPRRKQLLESIGIEFEVKTIEVDEVFPAHLNKEKIPVYLAELKAKPFQPNLKENDLVITADTIVWYKNRVLGKPENEKEAKQMLQLLSGKKHQVISGVCLTSKNKQVSFSSTSNVWFKVLANHEIDYYIEKYKPYDKAGAYGIQEWIGAIGITHIEGSFYNVMGLPIQKLYEANQNF